MKIEVDYTLLRKLVDYNWDAEEKHFEESLEDELPYSEAQEPDHIFHVIKKLNSQLDAFDDLTKPIQ